MAHKQLFGIRSNKNQKFKTFNSWFFDTTDDIVEKTISLVVLAVEIGLLFFHNIPDGISFYIFTGLNCFFSFFIYLTFWENKNSSINILSVMTDKIKYTGDVDEDEKKEIARANTLMKQFKTIRYAWLFTSFLYIIFILQHYYTNASKDYNASWLYYLMNIDTAKKVFKLGTIIVSLSSTYFYLVAYYVMYFPTIDENTNTRKNLHYRKTIWWVGVMLFILIAYLFFYAYYGPGETHDYAQIRFENKSKIDTILLTGKNLFTNSGNIVIPDNDNYLKFQILKSANDSLSIELDSTHSKDLIVQDNYHKFINISSHDKIVTPSHMEVVSNLDCQNGPLQIAVDCNIENLRINVHPSAQNGNAVDFVFQMITGLISALVMCFFIARFESITFGTPSWILIALYLYAVIQGFLVVIDADFISQNELLQVADKNISEFVFFVALVGKIILYIYIRLFFY